MNNETTTVMVAGSIPAILEAMDVEFFFVLLIGLLNGLYILLRIIKMIKDWNK